MDFTSLIRYTIKMEVPCCACCDWQIYNEKDAYYYEPLDLIVCEECHEALQNGPVETPEEPDIEMEDLMSSMTIS
jgi:hypothetical protein